MMPRIWGFPTPSSAKLTMAHDHICEHHPGGCQTWCAYPSSVAPATYMFLAATPTARSMLPITPESTTPPPAVPTVTLSAQWKPLPIVHSSPQIHSNPLELNWAWLALPWLSLADLLDTVSQQPGLLRNWDPDHPRNEEVNCDVVGGYQVHPHTKTHSELWYAKYYHSTYPHIHLIVVLNFQILIKYIPKWNGNKLWNNHIIPKIHRGTRILSYGQQYRDFLPKPAGFWQIHYPNMS